MKPIVSYLDQLAAAEAQIIGVSASFAAAPKAGSNPYAVLALFDASFATFSSDYADAIAALEASLADLKAAKKAVQAATSQSDKEKAAAGAVARAEATADFATNVAKREKDIAEVQKTIATAMGVSVAKDASVEQLAAKITAAVKTTVGVSDADIANMSADLATSGAANAVLRAKLEDKMEQKAFKELGDKVSAAAKQEKNAAQAAVTDKAKAQLAKKAADAVLELEAAKKAAGKNAETDKTVQLLKKLAKAAEDNADANNTAAYNKALKEETTAANNKLKDIATAANEAGEIAEKVYANKGNAEKLQEALNKAKQEAKNTADNAQKAEAAASTGYAAKIKIGGEEVKIIFESRDAYATFADGKNDAAAIETALAAVKLNELTANKISSVDGWAFDGANATNNTLDAQYAGQGVKFTIADAKTITNFLATTAKFDKGIVVDDLIANGGISALNGMAIKKATNDITITVATNLELKATPDAKNGANKFSAEQLEAMGKLAKTTKISDLDGITITKAGDKGMTITDGVGDKFMLMTLHSKDFLVPKSATLGEVLSLGSATDEAGAGTEAGKIAGAVPVLEKITSFTHASNKVNSETKIAQLADGKALAIDNSALKGYILKAGSAYDWIPEGSGVIIHGVDVANTAKDTLIAVTGTDFTVENVKAIMGNATSVKINDTTITLTTGDSHKITIGGSELTFGKAAKAADVLKLKADSSVDALKTAKVSQIGADLKTSSSDATILYVKKATGWDNTLENNIKLTLSANTVKLSAIKDLTNASTAEALVKAGVTKVGDAIDLVKVGDVYAIKHSNKLYELKGANLGEINAFEGTATEKIVDITTDVNNKGGNLISTLTDGMKAGEVKFIADNTTAKGTLTKLENGKFSWTSADGKVVINDVKTGETITKLITVADKTATITQAKAIAATSAKITVDGATVTFPDQLKIYTKDISGKGLDKLAAYQAEASIATLKELVTVGNSSGITLDTNIVLKNAETNDSGAWSLEVGTGPVASVNDVPAATAITKLTAVTASTSATLAQLKAIMGAGSTITKDAKTITYNPSGEKFTIAVGAGALEIDTAKATDLGKLLAAAVAPTGLSYNSDHFEFSFGDGSAVKTLDLSGFKTSAEMDIRKTSGDSGITADSKKFTVKLGDGDFKITTDELSGDDADAKMIVFDLTDFNGGDKLVLTFANTLVAGANDQTISNVGTGSKELKTANSGSTMAKVTLAGGAAANDAEALAAAAKLDSTDATVGAANAMYCLDGTDEGGKKVLYLINTNKVQNGDSDSTGDTDAIIVKLIGLNTETIDALKKVDVTTAATLTITGVDPE